MIATAQRPHPVLSVPEVLLTSEIIVPPVHGRGNRTVPHYLFIQLNNLLLINAHLTLGSNYIFQIVIVQKHQQMIKGMKNQLVTN